uniref:Transcriptional adapter 2-alpha/beta-like domain-containing protein n=1 Tax=Euplotes crassus TaxID=5936 RepID=A0A7S3KAX6_EUPCR|mmetsp:Transcript_18570/g.18256  ORF Transcript_18570/g.18256 Transcript_18570/m.18256 type:complete len:220 (+) Transcript_18570:101-760(+)|eukprot:CAMPEP_0196999266 /NCGR_PEP_ID=MMETSP1380-20130617/4491_1 /TAXON_ID=5936 /ORGANISM="Euplotes crassus, Strain CT5" /LENGTH=219 /DNA_ID=CAMNT_0042416139 /DNA_START=97 /DNA_END=756 /DNA_ORIENTATION=+
MPAIEEVITKIRGDDFKPVLNTEIIDTNKAKKAAFQEEKKKNGPKHQEERSKESKKSENIDDPAKKQDNPISDVRSLVGYMPKRGDFDNEYDEEAETRICEMEFLEDDTDEEIELKFKVLEYYNARLDERIRRKKFVIDRGLLDIKKIQKQEKKLSKEERDIINCMKPFARFSSKQDHEKRVTNMLKEYKLRTLINQLKTFKSLGLKSLSEIEKHIEEK